MLTDGVTRGRATAGAWLVAEDRDTPYDGSAPTGNPLRERTRVRVWLFTGDLRIGARSGIQVAVSVPDVTRSAVIAADNSSRAFSETFRGLGDTSLVAWHRPALWNGWNITVNGGVSVPTGRTERPRFRAAIEEGSLVPVSRLQRGSGTFDPLIGFSVNRLATGVVPGGARLFASAAARLPVAENEYGLRTGASWETGGGLSREIVSHRVVGIFRASWLHRSQDVFEGTPVLVGGGNWLYLAPAVAIDFGAFTAQAEIKLPVWRDLANRQLDSSRLFQLGLVRRF